MAQHVLRRRGVRWAAALLATSLVVVPGTDAARIGRPADALAAGERAPDRPPFEIAKWPSKVKALSAQDRPPARGFDATYSERLESETTDRSELYRNTDGTLTQVVSPAAVRFKGADNAWHEIDATVVDEPDGSLHARSAPVRSTLRVEAAKPTLELPTASGTIRAREDSHPVRSRARGNRERSTAPDDSASANAALRGDHATLDTANGRELRYRFLSNGVKEDVVLSSAAAGSSFELTFDVPAGLTARQGDGEIEFATARGKVVSTYGDGLAGDAVAVAFEGEVAPPGTTTPVLVDLVRTIGRSVVVRVSVDPAWFAAPSRAFPVTIDPILQNSYDPGTDDVYLNSDNPSGLAPGAGPEMGVPYVSQTHLRIGNKTGAGFAYTYLPFNNISVPSGYTYTSAYLQLYAFDGNTCASTARVMPIASTWNASTSTYDSRPTTWTGTFDGSQALVQSTNTWQYFTVTQAVMQKFQGPWYGLAIQADDNATTCAWREFYSADGTGPHPALVVTFTESAGPPPTTTTTASTTTTTTTPSGPPPAPTSYRSFGSRPSQPKLNDPVNVVTGNMVDTFVDLESPDQVFGMEWARTYNLLDPTSTGGMGQGWTNSLSPTIHAVTGGVEMIDTDGRRLVWATDGAGFDRPVEYPGGLSVVSGAYRVTFEDGTRWDFDNQGRLASKTDWMGHSVTITRDSLGQISIVTSSQGPQLFFSYRSWGVNAGKLLGLGGMLAVNYGYDDNGNLTTVLDSDGGITTYSYDTSNRLESITDPTGVVVAANTFDSQGRVVTQTVPSGAVTTFTYDGADSATGWSTTEVSDSVTGSAGAITYSYDADLRVRRIRDSLPRPGGGTGNDTVLSYDPTTFDLTSVVSRLGGEQTFTYDSAGHLTCAADPGGSCPTTSALSAGSGPYEAYRHDGQGRVDQSYASDEGLTTYTYTGANRTPTTITDANGKTTTYVISGGLVTQETDPDGVVTTYAYDSTGRLSGQTVAGNATTFAYDSFGRPRCSAEPGGTCPDDAGNGGAGAYTTTAYTDSGLERSTRSPDGGVTPYTYDHAGRVLTVTDPTGAVITAHYDATTGLLTAVDKPGAIVASVTTHNTWHYGYDANGNLTCEAAPGGACPDSSGAGGVQPYNLTTYGPFGRVTSTTNELGQTTTYAYDPEGNLTEVHNPDGGVTTTVYDVAGRVMQEIDAAGRVTATFYDSAGRISCVAQPGGNCVAATGPITTTTYDAAGQVLTETDDAGAVTTYTYTNAGRPATDLDPTSGATTSTYDTTGRLWKSTNALNAVTTLTYDARSRVQQETSPTGLVTAYAYDNADRVLTETDPAGVVTARTYSLRGELLTEQQGTQGTTTYTYNADSTIASVTDPLGRTTSYTYDARGNRLTRTNALGKIETWTYDHTDNVLTYADQLNRQTVHTYWDDPTNGLKEQVADPSGRTTTIEYNPDETVKAKTHHDGTSTLAYAYHYDPLGHLDSINDGTSAWGYTFDPYGRLTANQHDPATGASTSYTVNTSGQTTQVNDTQYTYDVLGRPKRAISTTTHTGPGALVAVGDLAKIGRSVDGTTWSQRAFVGHNFSSVVWSPEVGLFVAVAQVEIGTSPDGLTWTPQVAGGGGSALAWSPSLALFVVSAGANTIRSSPDGITWTTTTVTAPAFNSMDWSPQLGLFVATATGTSQIYSSTDGFTWTLRTSGVTNTLYAVRWTPGPGLFLVGGANGTILTSPNGVTWSLHNSGYLSGGVRGFTWSPSFGIFVAVIDDGRIATSPDGSTWTQRTNPLTAGVDGTGVVWAPELALFVLVTTVHTVPGSTPVVTAARMATSPDGITWTLRSPGFGNNSIRAIAWAPPTASPDVAVAYHYDADDRVVFEKLHNGTRVYTYGASGRQRGKLIGYDQALPGTKSTTLLDYDSDGRLRTDATNGVVTNFGYDAAGQLVSATPSTGTAKSWTYDELGRVASQVDTTSTVVTPGALVAVGDAGKIGRSPDGTTWTQRASTITQNLSSVVWSPAAGLFVGVAPIRIVTSPDGLTWTQRATVGGTALAWSPSLGLFVVSGAANTIRTSPDGITWTTTTVTAPAFNSMDWSPQLGLFVATATGTSQIYTSTDGLTWTLRTSGVTNVLVSVRWATDLGLFLVGGANGTILTSPDGSTWSLHNSGYLSGSVRGFAWSPQLGVLVAAIDDGRIATSPDGSTWTQRTNPLTAGVDDTGVVWAPELALFVLVTTVHTVPGSTPVVTASRMATSPDGITWTLRTAGFGNNTIRAIAWKPAVKTSTSATTTYRYDDANQLCWTFVGTSTNPCSTPPAGATTYTYDGSGRRQTEYTSPTNQVSYAYDLAGRLNSIQRVSGVATTTQTRSYDPEDLLAGITNTGATSGSSRFAWDKSLPVPELERITSGGNTTQLMYGAGDWIAQKSASGLANIGLDVYGSVVPTTGTSGLAQASGYDQWGKPNGATSFAPKLGYRGELTLDDLTNLRARDYQPGTQQFLSVDPLDGVDGSTTVGQGYAYADNDPLARIDPLGLQSHDKDFHRGTRSQAAPKASTGQRGSHPAARVRSSKPKARTSDRARAALGKAGAFVADFTGLDCITKKVTLGNCANLALTLLAGGTAAKIGSKLAAKIAERYGSELALRISEALGTKLTARIAEKLGGTKVGRVGAKVLGFFGRAKNEERAVETLRYVRAAEAELATPKVSSQRLQNIVNNLYKGTKNSGRVGFGTTADAIRQELRTGGTVFGKNHVLKGEESLRGLTNWLKAHPDAPYHDRLVARSLADDLLHALGRVR